MKIQYTSFFQKIKSWALLLKRDVLTIYILAKNPNTPWFVRLLSGLLIPYAFSPIDLIPDFIPILGYLDDLIIIPLGILLIIKLTPDELLDQARNEAVNSSLPDKNKLGLCLVIFIWISILAIIIFHLNQLR